MPIKTFYLILSLFFLIKASNLNKKNYFISRSLVNYDYCDYNCGGHGECYQVGKDIGTYYYRCLCDDGYCDERDERGYIYETVHHPNYNKCKKKCVDILKSDIKDITGLDPDNIQSSDSLTFFDFYGAKTRLTELYRLYRRMKDFEEFVNHPVKKVIKTALTKVIDKTVGALIDDIPLGKFSGITDFFGFFVDIGLDFILSKFRNLEEAQEEAENNLKKYVLINGDRAVKKIRNSEKGFSEKDQFGDTFYEVEIVKKSDINFPGWNKNDVNKCLNMDFLDSGEIFVNVKTKAIGEFEKKINNKCANRYYMLSLGLDLENECADFLGIEKKDMLGSNSEYCYEHRTKFNFFFYLIMVLILII